MILFGLGILATAGDFLRTSLDVNEKVYWLSFPRLARRFPRAARVGSWVGVVFGVLIGIGAIIVGLMVLLR